MNPSKTYKYFFNLTKRSTNKKHTTKLKRAEGSVAENSTCTLIVSHVHVHVPVRLSNFPQFRDVVRLDRVKQSLGKGPITQ